MGLGCLTVATPGSARILLWRHDHAGLGTYCACDGGKGVHHSKDLFASYFHLHEGALNTAYSPNSFDLRSTVFLNRGVLEALNGLSTAL